MFTFPKLFTICFKVILCSSSFLSFFWASSCRFATPQIPTDLAIQVQEVIFNVHKVTYKQK